MLWQDQTNDNVKFEHRPSVEMINEEWHYAHGAWVECPHTRWQASCESLGVYSSLGAFGFYPAVSMNDDEQYWLVIGQNALSDVATTAIIIVVVVLLLCCCGCAIAWVVYRRKQEKSVAPWKH